MRLLLAAVLFAASQGCLAEDWLVASGISYHLRRAGQNERNWGVGFERRLAENWSATFGLYDNSSSDDSAYAAAAWTPYRWGRIRAGLLGGVVSGYEDKPCLLGGLTGAMEWRLFGLNAVFIPAAGGVLFLQAKFRLD
jgi:hypothetical protein